MPKFTNKQLELIGDTILSRLVEQHKQVAEEIKSSEEYINFEDTLKDKPVYLSLIQGQNQFRNLASKYNDVKSIHKEIVNEIGKEIEVEWKDRPDRWGYRYTSHLSGSQWNTYNTIENMNNPFIQLRESYVKKLRAKTFPQVYLNKEKLRKEIETAILLGDSADAKEIIETIVKSMSHHAKGNGSNNSSTNIKDSNTGESN